MAIFKSLTFDGINSLGYGVYITGEAVYNAPERVVEMVSVPGRNGNIAIDQGRFENIEVTYHAGCFADSQADFADKVMRFRNALASRYTYKRLTDEYHSDEYRLGLYKSGLDVDAVRYGTAGQFDITFDCKPQRFLLSGETAVTPSDYGNPQTETGELVTIDSDGSLGVKSLEVSLSPIQEGSGEPSPTNIRPISGRTEVVTHRTGQNLLEPPTSTTTTNGITFTPQSDGSVLVNGTATGTAVYEFTRTFTAGSQYILSGCPAGGSASTYRLDTYGSGLSSVADYGNGSAVWTAPNGNQSIRIVIYAGVSFTNKKFYPMVRFASVSDATYEPYNGQAYTTALGRTVYGGTLDVVSGVLTVTHLCFTDSGDNGWNRNDNGSFYKWYTQTLPVSVHEVDGCACNYAPYVISFNDMDVFARTNGLMSLGKGWGTIYPDVASLQAQFAQIPLQVVYKLATPQTYQLTPQQVTLLLGENHLWSDGEIMVEYGTHPYYNPTQFESKPLIVVTGKGILQIGDYVLTIVGRENQTIYIDCESQEAWEVVGAGRISRNDYIQNAGEEFPVLVPGINNISVGSGITAVTITPRWWRI